MTGRGPAVGYGLKEQACALQEIGEKIIPSQEGNVVRMNS